MRMEPVKITNISRKYHYTIYDRTRQIGEITYKIHGKYVIVGHLFISHEYRNLGYGYLVVEYLMKKYKTKYIVGETLIASRGFWHKCTKRYDGMRKNMHYCDNCSSAFIIPKTKIEDAKLWELLEVAYSID